MTVLSFVRVASILGGLLMASLFSPHAAKAQNRGTLQVTARVVDSRPATTALQAAKSLTSSWLADQTRSERNDVTTVAQVSVRPNAESRRLVVTIDYSKN